jgi:hypothetical protein
MQKAGAKTRLECLKHFEEIDRRAACKNLSELACQKLINRIILAEFVDQTTIDLANNEVAAISGKYLEIIKLQPPVVPPG